MQRVWTLCASSAIGSADAFYEPAGMRTGIADYRGLCNNIEKKVVEPVKSALRQSLFHNMAAAVAAAATTSKNIHMHTCIHAVGHAAKNQ